MSDYLLIRSPNPNGQHYYSTRRTCQHGRRGPHLIVMHTSEQLPDYDPPDATSDSLSRYVRTTTRTVSWHSHVDSDSTVKVLPGAYTAFHVRGFNRCSLGLEMCIQARLWREAQQRSPAYVDGLLRRAAAQVREWSSMYAIPLTRLTAGQVARDGLIGHVDLDPTRRSDPGRDFPWDRLLTLARGDAPLPTEEDEMLKRGDRGRAVRAFQHALIAEAKLSGRAGGNPLPRYGADGDYGAETEDAVKAYQRGAELPETGSVGDVTAALLSRYIPVPQAREETP